MTIENLPRNQIYALAREQLAQKGILRVRVITTSMQPLIRAGETIVVESADAETFARGDIVLFRAAETWFAHRLVARVNDEWVTKGDRAPSCDTMKADEWIGRVSAVENATRRFELRRLSSLARVIAFLSLRAARAEEKKQRVRARIGRVLTRFAARSVRVLAATARNV